MLILLPLIASGIGGENLYELIQAINRDPEELVCAPIVIGCMIALGVFASILVHELGHAIAAQRKGAEVTDITVMLLGGITKIKQQGVQTPAAAFQIAVAGPLANLLLGGLSLLLVNLSATNLDLMLVCSILGSANLFIAAFNLIPAFPLDGGRVLEAILWYQLGRKRSVEVASSISRFIAIAVGIFGLLNGMLLLVMMAVFFYFGGVAQGHQLLNAPIDPIALMKQKALHPVLAVEENMTPADVAAELKRRGYLLALIHSVRGHILGIIDLQTLEQSPDDRLDRLPLEHVKSVHVDEREEVLIKPDNESGWFVFFDEYNVLLGATPTPR